MLCLRRRVASRESLEVYNKKVIGSVLPYSIISFLASFRVNKTTDCKIMVLSLRQLEKITLARVIKKQHVERALRKNSARVKFLEKRRNTEIQALSS